MAHRTTRSGTSGRQTKRKEQDDEIPEVYREMLAEAEEREDKSKEGHRPVKRRKVGERMPESQQKQESSPESNDAGRQVQTAFDSTADESDMEWEDVDIHQSLNIQPDTFVTEQDDEPLSITLDEQKGRGKRQITRRKPVSGAEKKLRLDIHKAHLLCLLRHAQIRNMWCNDEEVQGFLKKMLPKKVVSLLNPPEDMTQYNRSTTFMNGLNQACEDFIRRFRVTRPGLKQAHWADDPEALKQRMGSIMSDAEIFLSKDDFQKEAKILAGSRDFGAQLFCALLRSVAVEARLVCSLQPLPFSGAVKNLTPVKAESNYLFVSDDDEKWSPDSAKASSQKGRRLGRPQFTSSRPQAITRKEPRPEIRESSYPVFWVEAFNEAVQKWVPVDPMVTKTLAKPSRFEPPASDQHNTMCYVVAFEEDASARDVTRRYAKAFNAKTRKLRVESTKAGERWWARALRFYEKPFLEDRDELEISELTAKIAAEPMPQNVQDFKDHPIYALERHLRRNEAIFPKRAIGQVCLSKASSKKEELEPVYRRSDVHTVRSADGWYRMGRDIKIGQQPLKRVQAAKKKTLSIDVDGEADAEDVQTPLYSFSQTELYTPPPVVNGKIPKNAYGNLDIYVPTMVPPGGVHINRPGAKQAARILGIDYADAVTGFEFRGRHGTAIIQGVVIASEYREALEEVVKCLEDEQMQAEAEEKSNEALETWQHFLLKLRIAQRVKKYVVEGEDEDDDNLVEDEDEDYDEPDDMAGGFFPEPGQETATPTNAAYSTQTLENQDKSLGGGFIPEETMGAAESEPKLSASVGGSGLAKKSQKTAPLFSLNVTPNTQLAAGNNIDGSKVDTTSAVDSLTARTEGAVKPAGDLNGSSEAPIAVDSPESKSASVEEVPQVESQSQAKPDSPKSDDGWGSDYEGSLLSHDPEDEDAIPEWLL